MIRRRVIPLLFAVLALLGSSLAFGQTAGQELPPLSAGELCAQPQPIELKCPKTGADLCLCYMSTRTLEKQGVEAPTFLPAVSSPKAPRPGRRVRVVGEPPLAPLKTSVPFAPPTPPPRA